MSRPRSSGGLRRALRGTVPRSPGAAGSRRESDRHAGSCTRESGPPGHPRGGSRQGISCNNRLRGLRREIRRERGLRGRAELVLRTPGTVGARRESGRHAGSRTREGRASGGPRGTDFENRTYRPIPEGTLVNESMKESWNCFFFFFFIGSVGIFSRDYLVVDDVV